MPPLPVDIVQFARSYIRTIEELETLIMCVDHRDRWWDATSLAGRIRISESRASRALDHLARTNLLDIRITDAIRYRFHPGTEDLETRAAAFASAYHRNRVDVVKLIARAGVADSVRDFADAFRIKRDDNR
jgi:hypothetical protein